MTDPTHHTPAAPRPRTLGALAAGVLLAHLALMAGDLPDWRADAATRDTVRDTVLGADAPTQPITPPNQAMGGAAPSVLAPTVSRVRWIAPAEAPAPPWQPDSKAPLPLGDKRARTPGEPAPSPEAPVAVASDTSMPVGAGAAMEPPVEDVSVSVAAAELEMTALEQLQPVREDAPMPHAMARDTSQSAPENSAHRPQAPFVQAPDELALTNKPAHHPRPANSGPASPTPPLAAAQRLPPAQVPAAVRLLYDVSGSIKGFNYSASARLDWEPVGTRYDLRTEVRVLLLGKRVQTSSGRLDTTGLHPDRFSDRSRSEKAAHFDYVQQRIRYSSNAPESPLLAGAQDRLSVFLQLSALFNARPETFSTGQTLSIQVAGTGGAEVWQFDVGPQETLALPVGSLSAWRLSRVPRKPYDTTVDIWLAPTLSHLPVRIRVTQENGDVVDQHLSQMP